jgi:hypothetical protein
MMTVDQDAQIKIKLEVSWFCPVEIPYEVTTANMSVNLLGRFGTLQRQVLGLAMRFWVWWRRV